MTDTDLDVEELDAEWAAPAEFAPDYDGAIADLDDRPIVVSAFAGIGGFDLGFEAAGFQTGVQIEWDAAATRVLKARFPRAAHFGDVRHVNGQSVRAALSGRPVAVLCGGFPCVDLSVAGRRAGLAGERSGLYTELLRLAEELTPDWLVVENVPGLLSADADPQVNGGKGYGSGSAFALFLGDVTGFRPPVPEDGWRNSGVCHGPLGTAAWRVLDARHFGVAQRRRRVFVVVDTGDRAAPAAVLLEPEGLRGHPAARVPSWARAAAAVVGAAVPDRGVGVGRDGTHPARPALTADQDVVTALTGGLGSGGPDAAHAQAGWLVSQPVDLRNGEVGNPDEPAGTVQSHGQSYSLNAQPSVLQQMGHVEANGGDDIAPTVTSKWHTGSGGPAGSETPNLIVESATSIIEGAHGVSGDDVAGAVQGGGGKPGQGYQAVVVGDGGTDVTHPVTASGTDGMGRGIPAVAYPIQDGRDVEKAQNGTGVGDADDPGYTLDTTGGQAVAFSVAVRGRDGGSQAELGEPEVANTLRAGDGGSSRTPLVLATGILGEQAHTLTSEGADSSEDGTGRGTPIVAYGISSDALDRSGEGAAGDAGSRAGLGVTVESSPTLRARAQAVAVGPEIPSPQPSTSGGNSPRVFRKAKRAQTDTDDETWEDGAYANTLNTFDGGDARATEIIVEPDPAYGVHITQNPIHGEEFVPALGYKSTGQGVVRGSDHAWDRADATEAHAREVLRRLLDTVGEEAAARWVARVVASLWAPEVLRPGVHEAGVPGADTDGEPGLVRGALPGEAASSPGVVRDVRPTEGEGRPPQGRGSHEQRADEPDPPVPVLPRQSASAAAYLLGLHEAAEGSRLLRHALPTVEALGRPLAGRSTGREEVIGGSHAAVRRLTPRLRECERLQGFPDDWTLIPDARGKPASDSPRYKQLGNAVCATVSEWVACRIADYNDHTLYVEDWP